MIFKIIKELHHTSNRALYSLKEDAYLEVDDASINLNNASFSVEMWILRVERSQIQILVSSDGPNAQSQQLMIALENKDVYMDFYNDKITLDSANLGFGEW